jgi:hypothetical protein
LPSWSSAPRDPREPTRVAGLLAGTVADVAAEFVTQLIFASIQSGPSAAVIAVFTCSAASATRLRRK